jgi:serine/threonine protein kinase
LLKTKGKSTSKSDAWSFGVILWEIFTYGNKPYPLLASNEEVAKEVANGYRLIPPDNCPEEVKVLMTACWQHNADDRPTFADIYDKLDTLYRKNQTSETQEPVAPLEASNEYGTTGALKSHVNTGGYYNA